MNEFEAAGLRYRLHADVYEPSDDTFLLLDAVRAQPPGRLLEIGTGAGLVAIAAARAGHRVVATDINPAALRLARDNARLNGAPVDLVRADLARGLRVQAFDVVVFNPPYLPTAPHEHVPGPLDAAFDGGPTGRAVVERLLATWPRPSPPLLLVTSSLQGEDALAELAHAAGLHVRRLGERRFPHERLALQRLEASAATPGSSPRNAEGF